MGWFDVLAGIATGGLYTAGKAVYQAGNAAEEAGNAAEQAGLAIAVIGTTIESVGEQLVSTLKETEELLTVKRLTPRSESDLWDEEKARLDSLKQERIKLKNELNNLGVSDPSNFSFDFWDFINDMQDIIKKFQLMAKLAAVNREIHDILYQEPGILSTGIYNAKEVLERLNTIEQPMLEDILASVDDNLEVSEEVLEEIKKLFVIKKKVSVPVSELSPSIQDQLEMINSDKLYYDKLLTRKDIIISGLADVIQAHPENVFEIGVGTITVPKENIYGAEILDDLIDMGDIGGVTGGGIHEDITVGGAAKPTDVVGGVIDAGRIREEEIAGSSTPDVAGGAVSGPAGFRDREKAAETTRISDEDTVMDSAAGNISTRDSRMRSMRAVTTSAERDMAMKNISSIKDATAGMSKGYMAMMQPHGARISASLSTKFDGYQRNCDFLKAQKAFYHRQTLKLDRKYELLANKWIEEPGIVPKTLDELHGVLGTFRTEEQPRIDQFLDTLNTNIPQTLGSFNAVLENVRDEEQPRIDLVLDNVNANLEESKQTLSKANETMESVRNALSILDFDTKYVKIGAMAIGGLVVLDLFVGLIVLIRMALGY